MVRDEEPVQGWELRWNACSVGEYVELQSSPDPCILVVHW